MPLRKEVDLQKTVAAASGVFRDVCSEEPPYHMAEELWQGLKQGEEGARLFFVSFRVCAKMNGPVAALERRLRQEARDGLVF